MTQFGVLMLSAVMVLGLTVLPGSSLAQQKTLKEQLVGAWTLVSYETTTPDGTKQQAFGANPKGILILEAGGQSALVFGIPNRPKFKDTSNLRAAATPEEWAVAARGFAANFGTWSVDEANKTLIRKYEFALIPNNEGLDTKAEVSFTGDDLKLTTPLPTGGKNETVFRRAK